MDLVRCMPWLWVLLVDHVDEVSLGELSRVLSGHLLGVLQVLQQALLLGVEIDVLPEERIDLLPLVVLAVGIHRAHLGAACHDSG